VIGRVDPHTGEPADTAVAPQQLASTMLAKLGIHGCTPDSRFC
jgi:hypothetical protein